MKNVSHQTSCRAEICSRGVSSRAAVSLPVSPVPRQMFQVIQPERALYIQANNCVEARDWIDILTKVSQCNRKRLSTYHPSAYLNGHWLCCKLSADTAAGCTPCTGYVSDSRHLPVCLSVCLSVSSSNSFMPLPVVCRQTSSWMWMETERRRGFIPSSAHTCPK